MGSSSNAIGSKFFPENAKAHLSRLRNLAQSRLNKAFRRLQPLGPDSDLHSDCVEFRSLVQSYVPPSDPALFSLYLDVVETAWWACWASYDFTVEGFNRRFGERLVSRLVSVGLHVKGDDYGNDWFEGFFPLVDASGRRTDGPFDKGAPRKAIAVMSRVGINDASGVVVPSGSSFGALHPLADNPVKWAHFTDRLDLVGTEGMQLEDCLIRGVIQSAGQRQEKFQLLGCTLHGLEVESVGTTDFALIKNFIAEGASIGSWRGPDPEQFGTNFVRGDLVLKNCNLEAHEVTFPKQSDGALRAANLHNGAINVRPVANVSLELQNARDVSISVPAQSNLNAIDITGTTLEMMMCNALVSGDVTIRGQSESNSSSIEMSGSKIMGSLSIKLLIKQLHMVGTHVESAFSVQKTTNGEKGELLLDKASFGGRVKCEPSVWKVISAKGCLFEKVVEFMDVHSTDAISFRGTRFHGPLRFDQITTGTEHDTWVGRYDFSDVVFEQDAVFSGRAFLGSTDFGGSTWRGVPDFHQANLHPDTSFVAARFDRPSLRERGRSENKASRDYLMGRYERAFRSLKLKAEALRASGVESMFHRLEMVAKRENSTTSNWENALSFAYDALSEYGESFVRPLMWWLIQTLVVGMCFWALRLPAGAPSARQWAFVADALVLSFNNSVRPFYSSSAAFDRMTATDFDATWPMNDYWWFVQQTLIEHPVIFRWMLVGQNLFGLLLIFLFLMAIRRRFQISS